MILYSTNSKNQQKTEIFTRKDHDRRKVWRECIFCLIVKHQKNSQNFTFLNEWLHGHLFISFRFSLSIHAINFTQNPAINFVIVHNYESEMRVMRNFNSSLCNVCLFFNVSMTEGNPLSGDSGASKIASFSISHTKKIKMSMRKFC